MSTDLELFAVELRTSLDLEGLHSGLEPAAVLARSRRSARRRTAGMTLGAAVAVAAVAVTIVSVPGILRSAPIVEPAEHTTAPTPTTTSTATTVPTTTVTSAVLGPGGQAFVVSNGVQLISTDAGSTWSPVTIPGTLIAGRTVAIRGATIAAITLDTAGVLTYQRSQDSGKTWASQALPVAQQTGEAGIAVSEDGSTVAVAAVLPHSSGVRGVPVLFVGPSGQDLVEAARPPGGSLSWIGHHLVAIADPASSALFVSDDNGATWRPSTVKQITAAAGSEVAADAPSIGTPIDTAGRAVVPVTVHHGAAASLDLLATTDAATFTPLGSIPLVGEAGSGVTAVGTNAGPTTTIVADPTSTTLITIVGNQVSTLATTGLPGPVDSLTFSDATHGLATATVTTCPNGKDGCTTSLAMFRSTDGGITWTAANQPGA